MAKCQVIGVRILTADQRRQAEGNGVVRGDEKVPSRDDGRYCAHSPSTPTTILGNLSTRLRVETGDNVLIGGFIITGTQPKRIIVRAIGPSLVFAGALADPTLELRDSSGALIRSNDNWRSDQEAEIIATTIPTEQRFGIGHRGDRCRPTTPLTRPSCAG